MSEMTEQQILEKLSNMREFIKKLCVEYNAEAKKIDMNGRIAIMDASVYDYEEEKKDDESTKHLTWEEKAKSWDYETSMGIDRCNAGAWFPSAICYQ